MNDLGIFNRLRIWLSHARTHGRLQRLSDRSLADIGISRELLDEGVRAWPWRPTADADVVLSAGAVQGSGDYPSAVAELKDYDDAELAALNLDRSEIEDPVRSARTAGERERRAA